MHRSRELPTFAPYASLEALINSFQGRQAATWHRRRLIVVPPTAVLAFSWPVLRLSEAHRDRCTCTLTRALSRTRGGACPRGLQVDESRIHHARGLRSAADRAGGAARGAGVQQVPSSCGASQVCGQGALSSVLQPGSLQSVMFRVGWTTTHRVCLHRLPLHGSGMTCQEAVALQALRSAAAAALVCSHRGAAAAVPGHGGAGALHPERPLL